jgi:uncharacterized membrane protein YhaH (DUF805 family)
MRYLASLYSGRLNRRNFIAGWAVFFLLYLISGFLDVALPGVNSVKYLLQIVVLLPALTLVVSVYVRRLHDLGVSSFALLALIVPILNVIYFVRCLIQRGDPSTNRYGEAPPASWRFPHDLLTTSRPNGQTIGP